MPDFLSVGHVTRDEFPGGEWRRGGSAWYGAATSARLGRKVTLVTRVGDAERESFERAAAGLGLALHRLESRATTTFAFSEKDGRRQLRLVARARAIAAADLSAWSDARTVFLGSVIGEHHDDVFPAVGGRALLAGQGELRAFDAFGVVAPRAWRRAELVLPRIRVLVVSEEDLAGELAPARTWSREAPVVVTRAERGAVVLRDAAELAMPAYRPARVVDPTGAGDAFAAGLLVALDEGATLDEAADFANCVASFCLEDVGVAGLADRAGVEERRRRGDRLPM